MAKCVTKKRILPTKLCAGDLKHKVAIQTRHLTESDDFDNSQPVETFTLVRYQYCGIETVEGIDKKQMGVARFDGINILNHTSHMFWTKWAPDFPDIENGNHYLLFDDRRFKVLKVNNINELNTSLAIQCTERGEDSQEATKA